VRKITKDPRMSLTLSDMQLLPLAWYRAAHEYREAVKRLEEMEKTREIARTYLDGLTKRLKAYYNIGGSECGL